MLRGPSLRATSQPLSETIQWQIVVSLYTRPAALIIGGVILPLVACVSWVECRQNWLLFWAAAMLLVLAGRLSLARVFEHRADQQSTGLWSRRFALSAWTLGALWGCSAYAFATNVDPIILVGIYAARCVCVMGGAARNAGYPLAARGQILLGVVPGIIACMSTGKPTYLVFVFLMALEISSALTVMKSVYQNNVKALNLSEENVALVTQLRQASIELGVANEQLEIAAMSDALTTLANRRCFDKVLAAEVARAQRRPGALSLIMLDIDFFKKFNDLYGHLSGDDCLRSVALTLAATPLRPSDVVARYGGEEFVAILPQAGAQAAAAVAERVRAAIEGLGIAHAAGLNGIVTVSIGVASFEDGRHFDGIDLIKTADDALYAAKAAGRNCVRMTTNVAVASEPANAL